MELPEILTFVRQIDGALAGKTVRRAVAAHTPHGFARYTGDPAAYDSKLRGLAVTGADTYDATLRVRLGETCLLLTAPPRYHEAGKKLPPKHQLLLEFDDGSSLTCHVQMWGGMYLYKEGEEQSSFPEDYKFSFRPTALDEGFTEAHFAHMADECAGNTSLKQLLATEGRVPGLGNGCLQDILWNARLSPKAKLRNLGGAQMHTLHRATVDTVRAMTDAGGRDTERTLFGEAGGYKTVCSSKNQSPCPRCGGQIRREAYLGGNVYYCPACQAV